MELPSSLMTQDIETAFGYEANLNDQFAGISASKCEAYMFFMQLTSGESFDAVVIAVRGSRCLGVWPAATIPAAPPRSMSEPCTSPPPLPVKPQPGQFKAATVWTRHGQQCHT